MLRKPPANDQAFRRCRCFSRADGKRNSTDGEEIDITEHALLCRTLVRIARSIGLDRIRRDLTPTLADYLHPQQKEPAE